jgi:hypothetical protein
MGWNAMVKDGNATSVRQAPHFTFDVATIKSSPCLQSQAYGHSANELKGGAGQLVGAQSQKPTFLRGTG